MYVFFFFFFFFFFSLRKAYLHIPVHKLFKNQSMSGQDQGLVLHCEYLRHIKRKADFSYAKTKGQISCAVTAQVISAFVLLHLYSLVISPLIKSKFSSF